MDGAKKVFAFLMVFYCLAGHAAEVEYISPERRAELESLFKEAQFTPAQDTSAIRSHEWTCDMFGMRTHLQVQRGLKLYKWAEKLEWHNIGAQLVSDYKSEGSALVGHKGRFEDQVKISKDGQLVSRLSLTSPAGTVIAYSVCKIL